MPKSMPQVRSSDVSLEIKIVAVGDGSVGKTSMLISYSENKFPRDYVPTVFDNMCREVVVSSERVRLNLWDTAGQEQYDRLRALSYGNTDIFLVCFSVEAPDSLDNVQHKWVEELRRHDPRGKIILVGLKSDLRQDNPLNKPIISPTKGHAVAKAIRAIKYLECSAKTQEGLSNVFDHAIKIMLCSKQRRKKPHCTLI